MFFTFSIPANIPPNLSSAQLLLRFPSSLPSLGFGKKAKAEEKQPKPGQRKRLVMELTRANLATPDAANRLTFVKASLAQEQTQFSTAKKGARPYWGETFEFNVTDEASQTLDLSLMDDSGVLAMYRLRLEGLVADQVVCIGWRCRPPDL